MMEIITQLRITRLRHRYGLTFSRTAALAGLAYGGASDGW